MSNYRKRSIYRKFGLTLHAWKRMCARGLSPAALKAVLDYGRIVHTRGAEIYVLGRKEVARVANLGLDVARFEGVQVVCSPSSGDVLTVYRNRDLRGLRPRKRRQRHWS